MRITVLAHRDTPDAKELDVVVGQVADALEEAGHTVSIFGIHDDLGRLITGLKRRKPEVIFNLMETFGESQFGAIPVVGALDLLGIPYTGGGPGEFYLQEDKVLSKKLLAFDHIPYPDFAVFSREADLETGGNLRMPLFVKPLRMDASIGIGSKSLVRSTRELMERVTEIHDRIKDAALVEEYIEGREFYVGIVGNQDPTAFPPIEMDFSGLPEGKPRILDARAKWDEKSVEYQGTKAVLANLPDELRARLQKVALDAYRALRVRDYGRVDLRLNEQGEIYVIEVNASCYLERTSELARSAEAAGVDYKTLISRIVELALERRTAGGRTRKKEPGTRRQKKNQQPEESARAVPASAD